MSFKLNQARVSLARVRFLIEVIRELLEVKAVRDLVCCICSSSQLSFKLCSICFDKNALLYIIAIYAIHLETFDF